MSVGLLQTGGGGSGSGSSIELQTNGVDNSDQTKLNLTSAGTITVTDVGGGEVDIDTAFTPPNSKGTEATKFLDSYDATSGDFTNRVLVSGDIPTDVALAGNPTTTTQAITDNSTRISTTAYVTTAVANAVAGVNPAVAVEAATAAVLPQSPTYNNGASGVGAFLLAGSNAALVVDGYSVLLGDRLLVKTQASTFQNGVYTVTVVGSGAVPWKITRALDYNTPSSINDTGAIPVINGTVNTTTQWVLTSKVTAVGTDALTYVLFSLNPNATQTANTVEAGPTSGGAAVPTFRALVGADLPTPTTSTFGGVKDIAASSTKFVSAVTSGVPVLTQPAFTDLSGAATGAQLPTPTTSTFGGVKDIAAVSTKFVSAVTSGVPVLTQPAFTDISGTASLAQLNANMGRIITTALGMNLN